MTGFELVKSVKKLLYEGASKEAENLSALREIHALTGTLVGIAEKRMQLKGNTWDEDTDEDDEPCLRK